MKKIILLGFVISFLLLLTITITAQKRMDKIEVPKTEYNENPVIEVSNYNVAEGNLMDYDSWSN